MKAKVDSLWGGSKLIKEYTLHDYKIINKKRLDECKIFIGKYINFCKKSNLAELVSIINLFIKRGDYDIKMVLLKLNNNSLYKQLNNDYCEDLALFIVNLKNLSENNAVELLKNELLKFIKSTARKYLLRFNILCETADISARGLTALEAALSDMNYYISARVIVKNCFHHLLNGVGEEHTEYFHYLLLIITNISVSNKEWNELLKAYLNQVKNLVYSVKSKPILLSSLNSLCQIHQYRMSNSNLSLVNKLQKLVTRSLQE